MVLATLYTVTLVEWAAVVSTGTISSVLSIMATQGLVQRMGSICVEEMNE